MAQASHAALNYAFEFRHSAERWFYESNNIVILSVPSEGAVVDLYRKAVASDLCAVLFDEPDLGGQYTATCLGSSPEASDLCRDLPLAGRELAM